VSASSRVVIIKDDVPTVVAAINELVGKEVLVGIPDSSTDRDQEEAQPITNATLGYIHENGAPEANIPARPFLIPGVEKAEEPALERLKKAAQVTMRGDSKSADKYLNDAGIIASNSVKKMFWDNDWPPLQPATVANRHRKRGTKGMRDAEQKYLELIAQGMSPADAQSAAGIQPLVDTAQLRNSVTYILRKAK
jgi:hypothetical protein